MFITIEEQDFLKNTHKYETILFWCIGFRGTQICVQRTICVYCVLLWCIVIIAPIYMHKEIYMFTIMLCITIN